MDSTRHDSMVPLFARILLSLIFIVSGASKIFKFAQTAGYMASVGLPLTEVLLSGTILIEVVGGLMILLGWNSRWAAIVIFLWLIPTTVMFHAFWASPPDQMQNQMNNFMKNIAIMGGMLYVWSFGSGAYSLDARRANKGRRT
jgi:putative oxidoreductase